jgi:YesN/AraC family two-component response regulator
MIKETSQKFVNGLFSLIFEKNNNRYLKKMMKKQQVVAVGGYSKRVYFHEKFKENNIFSPYSV